MESSTKFQQSNLKKIIIFHNKYNCATQKKFAIKQKKHIECNFKIKIISKYNIIQIISKFIISIKFKNKLNKIKKFNKFQNFILFFNSIKIQNSIKFPNSIKNSNSNEALHISINLQMKCNFHILLQSVNFNI